MRARNVKPSLFKNELLATSDPLNTWIFEGLWCLADREGRLEDRPRRIHLEINPGRAYEGTEAALAWLAEQGFVIRYSHGAGRYIQIVNFSKHQNPHPREAASAFPAPSADVWKPDQHEPNERNSPEAAEWARAVKARDGKCVDCGATKRLHAHHVVPWENEATRYDLANGVTVCAACHAERHPELPTHLINGSVHGLPPAQPRQDLSKPKAVAGPALSPFPLPDSPFPHPEEEAPRAALATHLPADFPLTDARREKAVTENLDPERTFANFCDYWRSASGAKARKRDWDAAWRVWCRNDRGSPTAPRKPNLTWRPPPDDGEKPNVQQ